MSCKFSFSARRSGLRLCFACYQWFCKCLVSFLLLWLTLYCALHMFQAVFQMPAGRKNSTADGAGFCDVKLPDQSQGKFASARQWPARNFRFDGTRISLAREKAPRWPPRGAGGFGASPLHWHFTSPPQCARHIAVGLGQFGPSPGGAPGWQPPCNLRQKGE